MTSGTASASTTVTVSTTAATTALAQPAERAPGRGWGGAGSGLFLAGLLCLFSVKSRKRFRSMAFVGLFTLSLGGLLSSGCGSAGSGNSGGTSTNPPSSGNPGTTAGAYAITITATGNDALNTTSKATFTLTVQ